MKLSPLLVTSAALAACSYRPPAADPLAGDVDAAVTPDTDPATEPTAPPCSAPDAQGVVVCLEFDDGVDDGTLDDSSPGHHDAVTTGLSPATRTMPASSPAAQVGASAVTRIAETPVLDRDAAYTFAIWVHPDTLPEEGEVFGLIDHEDQYAMLIGHSVAGAVENRCVHTGVAQYEWTENIPANAWSFLACTWDGTTLCAIRWSSPTSHERYCHVPAIKPATSGTQGLAIGHLSDQGSATFHLDGAIDSLQIYDRGMSADALCSLLGQPAGCLPCNSGC